MDITKLEHATLLVDTAAGRVVIDPGAFTAPFDAGTDVVAVVITHEHADHWTSEHLERILGANPDAIVVGPAGVAAAASGIAVRAVADGDVVDASGVRLEFFGGRHAVIHSSIPVIDNVGVIVDDTLFYAGDSFSIAPGREVPVLAAPAGAPWMKLAESMDYVLELKPRRAFSLHEGVLSEPGRGLSHDRLRWATEQGGGVYTALEPGDSLTV